MQLYRDREGLFFEVRLRTYDPTDPTNQPFSGKDLKQGTRFQLKESTLPGIASIVRQTLDAYTKTWPKICVRDRVEINGRIDVLHEKLSRKRWAHLKVFDSEDALHTWLDEHQTRHRN